MTVNIHPYDDASIQVIASPCLDGLRRKCCAATFMSPLGGGMNTALR